MSKVIWDNFKSYFSQSIEIHHNKGTLVDAWDTCESRTSFYTDEVMPEVAGKFSYKYRKELFRVDYALCQESAHGHYVPIIFIESENYADTANQEMNKLVLLNSPCRVLIVCCEWSPGLWSHPGRQDRLIAEWDSIIKAHCEVGKLNGVIGVINAEWHNDVFRLTAAAWDENGLMFEKPKPILDLTQSIK